MSIEYNLSALNGLWSISGTGASGINRVWTHDDWIMKYSSNIFGVSGIGWEVTSGDLAIFGLKTNDDPWGTVQYIWNTQVITSIPSCTPGFIVTSGSTTSNTIIVSNAGTSRVNGTYTIVDATATGTDREFVNQEQYYCIYYYDAQYGWIIQNGLKTDTPMYSTNTTDPVNDANWQVFPYGGSSPVPTVEYE